MIRFILTILASSVQVFCSAQNSIAADSSPAKSQAFAVTLLGTGTPQPLMDRFGPGILVQAGTETLVFDAGRGCLQRLRQLNVAYNEIDGLFLTHLHSDHVVGLPDLWLSGWLISARTMALDVFGPAGTRQMTDHLEKAFSFDIGIRVSDDRRNREGSRLVATEVIEGIIYNRNGVKVIAFHVDHHPEIPAFGYRIEYQGHAVVLSGDTRFSTNLMKFSKAVDLLVHEVAVAPDSLKLTDPKYPVLAHHTTVEQVARIFEKVKPKLAAYSHIVKLYGRTESELLSRTKAIYSGPVVVGEDLMRFTIGDSVSVIKWISKASD